MTPHLPHCFHWRKVRPLCWYCCYLLPCLGSNRFALAFCLLYRTRGSIDSTTFFRFLIWQETSHFRCFYKTLPKDQHGKTFIDDDDDDRREGRQTRNCEQLRKHLDFQAQTRYFVAILQTNNGHWLYTSQTEKIFTDTRNFCTKILTLPFSFCVELGLFSQTFFLYFDRKQARHHWTDFLQGGTPGEIIIMIIFETWWNISRQLFLALDLNRS